MMKKTGQLAYFDANLKFRKTHFYEVYDFVHKHLNGAQHGFRKKRSFNIPQLLLLLEHLNLDFDCSKEIEHFVLYPDLKK